MNKLLELLVVILFLFFVNWAVFSPITEKERASVRACESLNGVWVVQRGGTDYCGIKLDVAPP